MLARVGTECSPPLRNHPLTISSYLLAPALPRPPQPTPGRANRSSAFQARSQVSADLAAPRNGPSGPAAARILPRLALLTAAGAPRSPGGVPTGTRGAEGTGEPCRPTLWLARLLGDRIKDSQSVQRGRGCRSPSFASESFGRGWHSDFPPRILRNSLRRREDGVSRLLTTGENGERERTFPRRGSEKPSSHSRGLGPGSEGGGRRICPGASRMLLRRRRPRLPPGHRKRDLPQFHSGSPSTQHRPCSKPADQVGGSPVPGCCRSGGRVIGGGTGGMGVLPGTWSSPAPPGASSPLSSLTKL